MSRIEKMIAELAPEGVRYFEIAQLFDLRNGYTPSKSNASFWSGGTVPWFRMEDIRANGGVLDHALQQIPGAAVKSGRLFPAHSILVATSATIGEHALVTVPHLSNQRFTSLSVKPEYVNQVDMKFVYYYGFVLDDWCRNNTTTSSFASVDMAGFKRFKFPVPPLEVQREIVRILDQFTQLEAELEAELEARRRQYEHYRAQLLGEASKGARLIPLGQIADLNWGDTNTTKASYVQDGERYPAYSAAGQDGYLDHYDYDHPAIVLSAIGALAGKTWRATGKWSCIKNTIRFFSRDEHQVLNDYLYWVSSVANFWPRRGSAQPFISKGDADRVLIPVPPLEEQRRVIRSLDSLDALVNSLSSGLPAEIAARRKQYEHYRDRLLTFKELSA